MHWVIQKSLFKRQNYNLLVSALENNGIEYTSIYIPKGTYDTEPHVSPLGRVYVCGAIKLKAIAEKQGWLPGSFLNENFSFDVWRKELGNELLNFDSCFGKFDDVDVSNFKKFFIRPLADNKAFDGVVIDNEMLSAWRCDPTKEYLHGMDVMVSSVKKIYREYRVFVVNNVVVTGSVYKVGGRPEISELVDVEAVEYVNSIINKWAPSESFVIDVSLSEKGFKVIEFNNINSSGFYAINIDKYIQAVQQAYG